MRNRRCRPTIAFVFALALALAGCGGGGGDATSSATPTTSSASTSTASPAQARRAEDAGRNPSGSPAYNQQLLPFRAAPLSLAQRQRLAKDGQTTFTVRVGKPGILTAFGQVQLGLSIVKVARAAPVSAPARGAVALHLSLTPRARGILAKGHPLSVYLAIRFSRSRTAQQLVVALRP